MYYLLHLSMLENAQAHMDQKKASFLSCKFQMFTNILVEFQLSA